MRQRHLLLIRVVMGAGLLVLLLLMSGCDALSSPQNTFAPHGYVANKQKDLFVITATIGAFVLAFVTIALLYIVIRYRRRSEDDPMPKQIHGNTRLEVIWTVIPAVILLALAVPTVAAIFDLGREPDADALHVHVIAFRWDWQFEYTDPEFAGPDGKPMRADELHIPVGQQVAVALESLDVIHSFWVPSLAGKLDVIPGRDNEMWFNGTDVGTYSAQCAEFCGKGHSGMKFTVVVESQEDFDAWAAEQLQPPEGGAPSGQPPPEQPQ